MLIAVDGRIITEISQTCMSSPCSVNANSCGWQNHNRNLTDLHVLALLSNCLHKTWQHVTEVVTGQWHTQSTKHLHTAASASKARTGLSSAEETTAGSCWHEFLPHDLAAVICLETRRASGGHTVCPARYTEQSAPSQAVCLSSTLLHRNCPAHCPQ